MKTKLFICTLFFLFQNLFSQDITGTWFGGLEIQGQKLPLVIHISEKDKFYKSTFDSPMQGAKGIEIDKTAFINNELTLDATKIGFIFKGKLSDKKISGNFSQNGMNLPMVFSRTDENVVQNRPQEPKPPFNYDNEEVNLKNEIEGNTLAGTLTTPKNFNRNNPVLVMITGSGAQNRDEELFGHKPFLVIADDFAKKGIATLRLDDRGIGGSEKGKDGATTADFATDINAAVNYLIKNGYKNIGLIGHSEGGMVAPMVANGNKDVKFLVLLAAPGIPIQDLMLKQTNDAAKIFGADEKTLESNRKINTAIYSFVNNYKGKTFDQDLKALIIAEFKKNPEDEMKAEEIEDFATKQVAQISKPWFSYFLKFNPDQYLSKVKIPVLALNGSLDLQVSAKENLEGIKKSLTKAGNINFEIVELKGLNHLFQTTTTGSPSEYGQIEETFSPKVLEEMTNWILQLKK